MNKPHPLRMVVQLTIAFFLILFTMLSAFSQVKIGDNPTVISPSAILETESTTKGFLKPRLTTAQRTAIAAPATGLEVYDTDTQSNWYYNGTVWVNGASTNIYNADGTLTGTRTVTQGANTLSFTGSAVNAFSVDGTTFSVDAANNAIGLGTAAPNTNAVIDATAVNKGILFPRVALTATNLPAPLSAFVAGMTVYNTATASTGATAVTPGLYYTDGTKWVQTGDDYAPDPTVGSISAFPFSAIPTGYLECNGAAVSRTTYAVLFAKIGTSYGAGDGSTTFNVPDLRGEFIRGWDNGRGVDAGRAIGSTQADATSLPNAAFTTNTVAAHTHSVDPPNTTSSSAGAHTHTLERRSNSDETSFDTGNGRQDESSAATTDRGTLGPFNTSSAGAHTHTTDIAAFNSAAAGSHNHTISGGDAETRPRNVAMVYAIKAVDNIIVPTHTTTAITAAAAANEPWYKVGTATGATSNTDDLYSMGNRVGIGTATPNAPLQFATTLANRKIVLWEGANNDHQFYGFGVNNNTLRYEVSTTGDNHVFFAGASATTSNELMRIQGNGQVGIGTAAPSAVLTSETPNITAKALNITRANVEKLFFVPELATGNYNGISSTGDVGIFFGNSTGNIIGVGAATSRGLVIGPWSANANQPAMKITEAGNVGIGTATPSSALQVNSANATTLTLVSTNTDPTGLLRIVTPDANTACNTCSELLLFQKANGTSIGSIQANLTANSVAYNTTSDIRLKENITETHFSVNDLLKIKVADYTRIGVDTKVAETGFLAQQLYEIYPQAVTPGGEDAKTNPWMVDYGKLTPLLVKSIQEQQKEIATLTKKDEEIDMLKKEVEALKVLMQQYLEKK